MSLFDYCRGPGDVTCRRVGCHNRSEGRFDPLVVSRRRAGENVDVVIIVIIVIVTSN